MRRASVFSLVVFVSFLSVGDQFVKKIDIPSGPQEVGQYEPFTYKFELPYIAGDISDPMDVMVRALVTDPHGKSESVPAFCTWNKKSKDESLWQIRFAPLEQGSYKYQIDVEAKGFRRKTAVFDLNVTASESKGFLRRSPENPYYLSFDSGDPFFGIGHNVAWVHNNSVAVFDRYFQKLADSGGNLTRVWLSAWAFRIEWDKLGEYDQDESAKIDELVELAEKRGIYIILTLDTYGSLMEGESTWGEARWNVNPYNKKNGGPCEKPEDFFTDPLAKHLYKNRLRYIISRWGYSPNIMAFELWNEYNSPPEWVNEMAEYAHAVNPQGQFVTTSVGYPFGKNFDDSKIWTLESIDLVTMHVYGNTAGKGMVPDLIQRSREAASRYKKPFVVSEFGIDFDKDDKNYDPDGKGTALHNSLWASAMSGSFATAMNWWYDTYIRPKDLYPHYNALASFLKGVDWNSRKVEYARALSVMSKNAQNSTQSYRDVEIKTADKWGKMYINEFVVGADGELTGGGMPNKYLHGSVKKDIKTDHIFHVDYPKDGEFIIHVGTVSQGGDLKVYLDGKEVLARKFPADSGTGPWKKSLHLKKYDVYQCIYDEDIKISVSAGEHEIKLSNEGKDWIGIESIKLTGYVDSTRANVRCLGLVIGAESLFWMQNKDSNWRNTFDKKDPPEITGAYFEIPDLEDGEYTIEWWNTYSGEVIARRKAQGAGKKLTVEVPDFSRDIACKIKRVK